MGGVRGGWHLPFELLKGTFQHAVEVAQDLVVPEAEYPEALSLQPSGTPKIVLPSFGHVVLTTIDLYYKSVFEGDEIDDVRSEGSLPAKLGSAELAAAKLVP
jgi:hypothetical protein